MLKYWFFESRIGTFSIVEKNSRFHVIYEDDLIDHYASPQQAAQELADGDVPSFVTSTGEVILDTSQLNIPADLGRWDLSVH